MKWLLIAYCLFLSILAKSQLQTVSLNGTWQFKIDRYESGLKEGWHTANYPTLDWNPIQVPDNWDIENEYVDFAGIRTPKSVTGKSLVPVIRGKTDSIRNNLYYAYRQYQRAYRKGNFKLIEYVRAPDYDRLRGNHIAGSRVTQLFNISLDPWETYNLADFPEYGAKVADMRIEMRAKAKEFGDYPDEKRTTVDFWEYYD